MSKWDKLLARLNSLSADMRFEELCKILEHYGYSATETSGGSSHITFRKAGMMPITIPRHSPISKTYIKLVRDTVMEEDEK